MIRKDELLDAIAECLGQRDPNANTCIKLASFYTILDHLDKEDNGNEAPVMRYSFAAPPEQNDYDSGTEFSDLIQGKETSDVLAVMDELMTTLSIVDPRLYRSVMRKL